MTTIGQPYCGRWDISDHGTKIGVVNGDFVIGFVARDLNDRLLGHFPTHERALYAVLHPQSPNRGARQRALVAAH
jgi:hypothetical protein